ncbi:MAG: DNA repair protein RecO [Acidimicrobiales bacterium]|nr:DNA repair protein RecO [Acidimicrobiales bacterium]MCB1015498.1 DNA repair protein RecO [Acidimicrobiales bacterium]MCB9372816.1 DNA repair protein RecO [Microthrixaceae bacterium]
MSLYRDHGIVLRTHKLGEADRIVALYTAGHGKVRAVAKGVRKTRSKFGARLEPTSHVAAQFYEGRTLDIVTQADTVDHFRALREDLDRFARASAMLEAVDQVSEDAPPAPALYQLLLRALRTLAAQPSDLVVGGFFWKLLALEGLRPTVDRCVRCGATGSLVSFDLDEGGLLCRACRRGTAVSPEAVVLLRQILGGQLAAALAAPGSPATTEVETLATRALEHHLERRLRSLGVLEQA